MGRFLLARVGKPIAVTAGEQPPGAVQLGGAATAINYRLAQIMVPTWGGPAALHHRPAESKRVDAGAPRWPRAGPFPQQIREITLDAGHLQVVTLIMGFPVQQHRMLPPEDPLRFTRIYSSSAAAAAT